MSEPGSEGSRPVRRAGIDRPGGRRAAIPVGHRSPHSSATLATTGLPPVFGEVSPRRGYKPTAEIRRTVIPAGIVDPEPEIPGESRKPLEIGDVRYLSEAIMGYEEYQPKHWRPAGGINPNNYTLTKIIERNGEAPLYRWSREHPKKPIRHVYIKPLGPGLGWEKVEAKDENTN